MTVVSVEAARSLGVVRELLRQADSPTSNRTAVRAAVEPLTEFGDLPAVVTALEALGIQVDGVMPFLKREFSKVVQAHLDEVAQERGYDGILTLCSYYNSTDTTFQAEAQAGATWRDAVWATCATMLDEVHAETRAVPTVAGLLAELPTISW